MLHTKLIEWDDLVDYYLIRLCILFSVYLVKMTLYVLGSWFRRKCLFCICVRLYIIAIITNNQLRFPLTYQMNFDGRQFIAFQAVYFMYIKSLYKLERGYFNEYILQTCAHKSDWLYQR